MTKENRESLLEIYQNFLDESDALANEIHDNELKIEEANNYLTNIDKNKSEDFNVFSPRNYIKAQQDEINQRKGLINQIENTNAFLKGRLEKINSYIRGLESVINENAGEKESSQYEYVKEREIYKQEYDVNEIIDKLQNIPLQNLNYLYHKAEMIKKFQENKPDKAKMEIETLSDQIEETIESLKSIINDIKFMMLK